MSAPSSSSVLTVCGSPDLTAQWRGVLPDVEAGVLTHLKVWGRGGERCEQGAVEGWSGPMQLQVCRPTPKCGKRGEEGGYEEGAVERDWPHAAAGGVKSPISVGEGDMKGVTLLLQHSPPACPHIHSPSPAVSHHRHGLGTPGQAAHVQSGEALLVLLQWRGTLQRGVEGRVKPRWCSCRG